MHFFIHCNLVIVQLLAGTAETGGGILKKIRTIAKNLKKNTQKFRYFFPIERVELVKSSWMGWCEPLPTRCHSKRHFWHFTIYNFDCVYLISPTISQQFVIIAQSSSRNAKKCSQQRANKWTKKNWCVKIDVVNNNKNCVYRSSAND